MVEPSGLASLLQGFQCFKYIQHAAQAQIIRYASVNQMEVGVFDTIIELPQFLQSLQNA